MENLKSNEEMWEKTGCFTPSHTTGSQNKLGINFIDNLDAGNFIKDIAGLRAIPETHKALTPRTKRINSSASNVKFGKLTIQRKPNKDLADVRASSGMEKKKVSRNTSPYHLAISSKSKFFRNIS